MGRLVLRFALTIALLTVTGVSAVAQPTFDVASVKPDLPVPPGQNLSINLGSDNRGTVTLANTTMSECIRYAYGLVSEDQISGPDWIRDRQFLLLNWHSAKNEAVPALGSSDDPIRGA